MIIDSIFQVNGKCYCISNFLSYFCKIMNQFKAFLGTVLGIVMLAASLLPTLHAFDHEIDAEDNLVSAETVANASVDCSLCDFHFSNAEAPENLTHKFFIPKNYSAPVYSQEENVILLSKPLFSLRAPPALVI